MREIEGEMEERMQMFKNETIMVTDLMKRRDIPSLKLLEYFEKNFDVDLEKVRSVYNKRN